MTDSSRSGAETFLHMLLTRMQTDLAMSTSSLICLPLEPSVRRKAGDILIPSKMKVWPLSSLMVTSSVLILCWDRISYMFSSSHAVGS